MSMLTEVWKLLFKKPFTNKFPSKYAPKNVHRFLSDVEKGKERINPPIDAPPDFRGRIEYDAEKCIGCGLCIRVCPTKAIEWREADKKEGKVRRKVKIYLSRCCFCSQCVDICPVDALEMSDEFLLANEDKLARELIDQ